MAVFFETGMLHPDVNSKTLAAWAPRGEAARQAFLAGQTRGSEFLGWRDLGVIASPEILDRIESVAKKLRGEVETMVVIGIGGSYLGAKAAIDALGSRAERARLIFAGQNISSRYHRELLEELGDRPFAINVISKSGTTTEPAIAYRLLRARLIETVGAERAAALTIATTDPSKGALRDRARRESLTSFEIPENVGGRFSVLTPVGLLPLAFAGVDIRSIIEGAQGIVKTLAEPGNAIVQYALARNALYAQGFTTEILSVFEPRLASLCEWWKQLFGESEGKDHMGIFPASLVMTTDLHSLGQYVQDGRRQLFETFLTLDADKWNQAEPLKVPASDDNADGLGYLAERSLEDINREALRGTQLAHREGGVPISQIRLCRMDPFHMGQIFYFFEAACAISGTLLGVNPFDQPAVEDYKRNMFALLGKPGMESETDAVRSRLKRYS